MDHHLDAELLEAWRAGDKRAGKQLFVRHGPSVARFFRNKFRTGADDLTQQTFLKLVESKERIREGVALRAYLLGIARNVMLMQLRRMGRGKEVDSELESMAALDPGPSTVAGKREEHRLLLEALRQLPIEHQVALELYYWEGYKAADIAPIMGVSPSAMRSRLAKARTLLEQAMARLSRSPQLLESTISGLETWARQVRGGLE